VISCIVHHDVTHELRSQSDEVVSIFKMPGSLFRQTQVGFMNQLGALDGVIWPLTPEAAVRDPAELIVDKRQECIEGILVAFFPVNQQFAERLRKSLLQSTTPRPQGLQSSPDTLHRKPI
jgi:hypothetical protein